jgi:hypothetical protein
MSQYDSCVYLKFINGSPTYLLLHVGDILIAAKSMKEVTALKAQLSREFDMKDLGAVKKILGMEIIRDRKSGLLYLSQKNYIEKVLHRFNTHNVKPVSTPLAPHFKLFAKQCAESDDDLEYMSKVSYSSVVGSLMYAMVCSRPDLSHALGVVSRYMANPSREHWNNVQWILRYQHGSSNACLCFGKSGDGLFGYVDSMDTWLILVESIGMLFSGISDICVVLLMLVYALVNLEMVCLVMLIQWIHG